MEAKWYENNIESDYPLKDYISIKAFEKNLIKIVKYIKNDKSSILLINQPYLYKENLSEKEHKTMWFGRTFCYERLGYLKKKYPSTASLGRAMKAFNKITKKVALSESVLFLNAADSKA